jgi:uncharacterized protein YggE
MDRTVTVTGQGAATAVPDLAVVRLAAVQRARRMAEAFSGVSAAVAEIGRVAAGFTDEKRIASRDLNVWPSTDNQGRQVGFEARHAVEIGCPSLDVAGAMLEALVAAVGDRLQVEGVTLQVAEVGVLLTDAREAAYADAVARATHLATLAGATLGPVLAVSEGSAQHAPYEAMGLRAAQADAAFHPGETTVGASVTATFALA